MGITVSHTPEPTLPPNPGCAAAPASCAQELSTLGGQDILLENIFMKNEQNARILRDICSKNNLPRFLFCGVGGTDRQTYKHTLLKTIPSSLYGW